MFSTVLDFILIFFCYCRCRYVYPDKGYLTNDDLKQKFESVDVILHIVFAPPDGLLASGQTWPSCGLLTCLVVLGQ